MAKGNGKTNADLDLDRELPPAEAGEGAAPNVIPINASDSGTASETEKLKAERDALLDRLARLQAAFDNARKRAVQVAGDSNSNEFRTGIDLIYRQLQDAIQKTGVQPIVAVGQPFDPRIHEAVEMVDTTNVPDHHVLEELQRGYKYKDRLLRPAMVRVARNTGA